MRALFKKTIYCLLYLSAKLKAYAGLQGFIKYDLKNGTANDVFNTYKNVKEVYDKIVGLTKISFKAVQKAPFGTK